MTNKIGVEGMSQDIPKTLLCCGLKPKRTFYQTAYRDDEGKWVFVCRKKCGKKIEVENKYRGTSKAELEATLKWNETINNSI